MAVFLILDETNVEGTFLRQTTVNAELIIRIDAVALDICSLRMQSFPSEPIYVKRSLKDMQIWLNCACA